MFNIGMILSLARIVPDLKKWYDKSMADRKLTLEESLELLLILSKVLGFNPDIDLDITDKK